MRSLRTRITLLNVTAVSAALLVATTIGVISIASFGHETAENTLELLCETGENNVDYYLMDIEQSVNIVSTLVDSDLDSMSENDYNTAFNNHIEKVRNLFQQVSVNTDGVLTYYYRIDPSVSDITGEKGFWYIDLNGNGFEEHEVTDLSDDQYECVWFYTPKKTGQPMWLPPYITDNLDVYVLSYNVPVYRKGTFIGVVGIEIGYKTIGEQIENIKAMNTGYAFIVENEKGTIVYHPHIDLLSMPENERPTVPSDFLKAFKRGEHHIVYKFEGIKKHSYVLPLKNGMSVVVCVPVKEINTIWLSVVSRVLIAAFIIISASIAITILFSRRITKPLNDLTLAAEEINKGNYKVKLDYKREDEIGILTTTVNRLIENLDGYISDLNSLAYADALTNVRNRSAFEACKKELQKQIDNQEENVEFAIALFDCDDLKGINDAHGHDKGNVYLRNSCHLICRIFKNSVVYRIGGDEFVTVLKDEDYKNRKLLSNMFTKKSAEICAFAKEPWEQIRVSHGIAVYDPSIDKTAEDVMIHADHLMYENKRERKKKK